MRSERVWRHSYEHHQGVALLASVPYVVDFVEMKRFEDDKQLQLLLNMRVPGGVPVPEETWKAIVVLALGKRPTAATLLSLPLSICSEDLQRRRSLACRF